MEFLELFLNAQQRQEFEVISTKYGTTKTTLPFFAGEIDYRTTLIRVLEITARDNSAFNPQRFSAAEQKWLIQAGILNREGTRFNPPAILLKNLGQSLYQSLFPKGKKSEEIFKAAWQRANQQEDELHIQFQFEANSPVENPVADYPWELLHDGERFLAERKISFSRYITYNDIPPNLPAVAKINVLLVSSEAFDLNQGLNQLGTGEREAIRNGLQKAQEAGYINLIDLAKVVSGLPTFKALQTYLTEHRGPNQPHVLHFDGHGLYGKKCAYCGQIHPGITTQICQNETCGQSLPSAQGYLVFADERGQPDYISALKLGATLQNLTPNSNNTGHGRLGVVVLSACQSGMAVGGDSAFNGVAQRLIQHRIPAVVAMQYSVSVKAASQFAEQFYRALGQKDTLSTAVRQARIVMDIEGNQWYRPVLYLRWHDEEGGQLFASGTPVLPYNQVVPDNEPSEPQSSGVMSLTLNKMIEDKLIDELAICFTDETDAYLLLTQINFPVPYRPNFEKCDNSMEFWRKVCEQIENGRVASSFEKLLRAAASRFPGNPKFKPFIQRIT